MKIVMCVFRFYCMFCDDHNYSYNLDKAFDFIMIKI